MTRLGNEEFAFSTATYREFLADLLDAGYRFADYDDAGPRSVIMRHDVDLSLERAHAMARVEADLGVRSTYFLLVTAPAYNLLAPRSRALVEEISALGHDVGLHFDTHYYWDDRPDDETLTEAVLAERASLECVVDDPADTVSFHIPPEWVLGERFDAFTNAYAPRYFEETTYVSDSNQKWRTAPPFPDGYPERLQILVHPGLWHEEDLPLREVLERLDERLYGDVARFVEPLGT